MVRELKTKGFTLVEMLISIFIISVLTVTVNRFATDVFSLNYFIQGGLNTQMDSRRIVKVMVTELREAGPSALGAYPIAVASSTGVTFYTDVNNDGLRDRVRYFVNGTNLRRGVVYPTGSPLSYVDASEQLTTVISGFVSSTTLPLFQYYPSNYAGTSSPLSIPVDIPSIRLVKITVIIDKDPNKSPVKVITGSQVNIRNLKDNL